MSHDTEELNHHIKIYVAVFVALLVLTGVTVAVSYLHLPTHLAIVVALLVALTKGTLVVGFFMHIFEEFKEKKPVLFWSLMSAVVGFLIALCLPVFTLLNRLGQ